MRRLPPPGVLSENEGDGELGGRVIELIKLGPLSILNQRGWEHQKEKVNNNHVKYKRKCAEFVNSDKTNK